MWKTEIDSYLTQRLRHQTHNQVKKNNNQKPGRNPVKVGTDRDGVRIEDETGEGAVLDVLVLVSDANLPRTGLVRLERGRVHAVVAVHWTSKTKTPFSENPVKPSKSKSNPVKPSKTQ